MIYFKKRHDSCLLPHLLKQSQWKEVKNKFRTEFWMVFISYVLASFILKAVSYYLIQI